MRILITGTTGFVGHKLKASYKDAIAAPSLRNATQDMVKKIVDVYKRQPYHQHGRSNMLRQAVRSIKRHDKWQMGGRK